MPHLIERLDLRAPVRRAGSRERGLDLFTHGPDPLAGVSHGDVVLQTAQGVQPVRSRPLEHPGREDPGHLAHGHPRPGAPREPAEPGREHPHDGERGPVQDEAPSHGGGIPAEALRPEAVAHEHHSGRLAGAPLGLREGSSHPGLHAQKLEVFRCHDLHVQPLGLARLRKGGGANGVRGEGSHDVCRVFPKHLELGPRPGHGALVGLRGLSPGDFREDDPLCLGIGRRGEQYGAKSAEDGGIGADPQGQNHHGGHGEAGGPQEPAKRVPDVGGEVADARSSPVAPWRPTRPRIPGGVPSQAFPHARADRVGEDPNEIAGRRPPPAGPTPLPEGLAHVPEQLPSEPLPVSGRERQEGQSDQAPGDEAGPAFRAHRPVSAARSCARATSRSRPRRSLSARATARPYPVTL